MAKARRLLLEYDAAAAAQGIVVTCAVAGPVPYALKEPVGHVFHYKVLRQQGLIAAPEPEDATSSSSDTPDAAPAADQAEGLPRSASEADMQPPPGVSWKKSKSKRKTVKSKDLDYYAIMGLKHERWTATESQLKHAYRKVCLEFHPDKKLIGVDDPAEKERIEDYFKQIQEAYDVLSDPVKRREYDSTDDFDDSLPLDCATADFFKVFTPAFKRNSRWSVDPKVPELGDDTAPWEQVNAFYDFWYGFKSWREFPHPDEEDVEGAESREHRRWIERNNAKFRERGKKEETKRLREFVEAAYRLDPRVAAKKEADRAERERKRAEKEAAARAKVEEEERRKKEEEAARIAAEEAAKAAAAEAKKQREADKKLLKRERQRLRQLAEAATSPSGSRLVDEDDVEKLCQTLVYGQLQQLADAAAAAGGDAGRVAEVLQGGLQQIARREEEEAAAKERQKAEAAAALKDMARKDHARKVAAMREWSDEELRLLDKAVSKYPQGTPKRWEQVTAMIRTRTLDEVLLMVKEKQGASSARMRAQEDWKGAAKKRAEVGSAADLRCNAFTDVEVEVVADSSTTNGTAGEGVSPSSSSSAATSTATAAAAPAGTNSGSSSRRASGAGAADTPAAAAAAAAPAAAGDAKKVVSADSGEWNEEQELALVQALKQCGKELSDRWERIAALVPGKTKAQCFKRFKELREVFRTKKGGDS